MGGNLSLENISRLRNKNKRRKEHTKSSTLRIPSSTGVLHSTLNLRWTFFLRMFFFALTGFVDGLDADFLVAGGGMVDPGNDKSIIKSENLQGSKEKEGGRQPLLRGGTSGPNIDFRQMTRILRWIYKKHPFYSFLNL